MDELKQEIEKHCNERHGNLVEIVKGVSATVNSHSLRINDLEKFQAGVTVEIRELCKQIQSLVGVIKWGSGTVIVFLIGFFIWYVQGI